MKTKDGYQGSLLVLSILCHTGPSERYLSPTLQEEGNSLDFRSHDLPHTAASWMGMQGADVHTVAQLLGHKDLRMAAHY